MKPIPAKLMHHLTAAQFSPLSAAILLEVLALGIWANMGPDPHYGLLGVTYGWPFTYCDPVAEPPDAKSWPGWHSAWGVLANSLIFAVFALATSGSIERWIRRSGDQQSWWKAPRYSRLSLLVMAGAMAWGMLANMADPPGPFFDWWGWPFLYYYSTDAIVELPPYWYSYWRIAANIAIFLLASALAAELIQYVLRVIERSPLRSPERIEDG